MFVELLPEVIGLFVTPLAIVAAILLLQSRRPLPNVLAFGGAFLLLYSVIALAALIGGAAAGVHEPSDSAAPAVIGIVIGALFLLAGVVTLVRKPRPHPRAPKWVTALEQCTPPKAFAVGAGAALLNPNIVILLSGLTIVVTAEVPTSERVVGAGLLLLGCALDFVVPIILYVGFGERGHRWLDQAKRWMVAHTRTITIVMFLVLGAAFVFRGIAKL